jgi:hypothetical protein
MILAEKMVKHKEEDQDENNVHEDHGNHGELEDKEKDYCKLLKEERERCHQSKKEWEWLVVTWEVTDS